MLTWRRGEEMMDKVRLEVRLRSKDLLERTVILRGLFGE